MLLDKERVAIDPKQEEGLNKILARFPFELDFVGVACVVDTKDKIIIQPTSGSLIKGVFSQNEVYIHCNTSIAEKVIFEYRGRVIEICGKHTYVVY